MTDGPVTPPPAGAPAPRKSLVERAKDILTRPAAEWPVIDAEAASVGGLIGGYAAILAAIAPLAMLLGVFLMAYGAFGAMGFLIKVLLVAYGISLGTVVLLGVAINLLAPHLGGTQNGVQAMKLAVYSGTAFWVASLILILSGLWAGWLWLILGVGYGGYLLWLGLPTLMKVSADKAPTFTAAAVGIWVVLFIILQQVGFRIIWSGMYYGAF